MHYVLQIRKGDSGKETEGKSKPPKEVAILDSQGYIKSPLSDEDYGPFMNMSNFPIVEETPSSAIERIEQNPSMNIYQVIIDRKTQDIMTIREFIKKEFFRKVSWFI